MFSCDLCCQVFTSFAGRSEKKTKFGVQSEITQMSAIFFCGTRGEKYCTLFVRGMFKTTSCFLISRPYTATEK